MVTNVYHVTGHEKQQRNLEKFQIFYHSSELNCTYWIEETCWCSPKTLRCEQLTSTFLADPCDNFQTKRVYQLCRSQISAVNPVPRRHKPLRLPSKLLTTPHMHYPSISTILSSKSPDQIPESDSPDCTTSHLLIALYSPDFSTSNLPIGFTLALFGLRRRRTILSGALRVRSRAVGPCHSFTYYNNNNYKLNNNKLAEGLSSKQTKSRRVERRGRGPSSRWGRLILLMTLGLAPRLSLELYCNSIIAASSGPKCYYSYQTDSVSPKYCHCDSGSWRDREYR